MPATRTDVHRPADLDPANYREIGFTDNHPEEGGSWIDPDYRGLPTFDGHYSRRGACDHCGHRSLRYAVHYLHEPSGEVVTVGMTCATKLGLSSRDLLDHRARAAAQAKADKIETLRREYPVALGVLDEYHERRDAERAAMREYEDTYDPADPDAPRPPRQSASEFFDSLSRQLRRDGKLSPKQLRALANSAITSAERQAKREVEAADDPEPTAVPETDKRIEISGKIVSVKFVESAYGTAEKMLVIDDRGFKVWGTRPTSLLVATDPERDEGFIETSEYPEITPAEWTYTRELAGGEDGRRVAKCRPADRGDRVKFTARVERSGDDETFGFFTRPTKAAVLAAYAEPEVEIDADLRERAEREIAKLDERIEAARMEAMIAALYEQALDEDRDRTMAANVGPETKATDLEALVGNAATAPHLADAFPRTTEAARIEAERRGLTEITA